MKIATWNLERPTKHGHKTNGISGYLKNLNADILILTETNEFIDLGDEYKVFHTEKFVSKKYTRKPGDRQVSIFTKYPVIKQLPTFRADTSICLSVDSPNGELIVYGTIIGNFGNIGEQFKTDLESQLIDFQSITENNNICIAGDLNMTFIDNFYFTKDGREKLNNVFKQLNLKILTDKISENIDHIVISDKLLQNKNIYTGFWNDTTDEIERLSDHKGVYVEILNVE